MLSSDNEEELLRSVALQNARAVLLARERAQEELRSAKLELERTNEELSRQREWFQVTLSSISDGVITTDAQCRVTFLNPVAEALTGWKSSEAIGLPLEKIFVIINELTRQPVGHPVLKVLQQGRIVLLANHTLLIPKAGGSIPIEDSAAPILDPTGNIAGVVMVFHDVTERKRKDEALRLSEQFNRNIIESNRDCVKVVNWAEKLIFISENGLRMLGISSPDAVLNKCWLDLWKPECRDDASRALQNARDGGNGKFVGAFKHPVGNLRWWDVQATPIPGPDGESERMLVISRDITERRRNEEKVMQLAAAIESSDDAILTMSLEGNVITWNRGAELLYRYSAAEMIGKPVTLLIPPDRIDEEPEILARLKKGERIAHYETIRRTAAGDDVHVSLTVSPIVDSSGKVTGISKIARDITQRKRDEEALKSAQEELALYAGNLEKQVARRTAALQEKIEELESFSYSVSHDLRAPVRAIQSFALILDQELAPADQSTVKKYLRSIASAAERMDRLILDVLSYSKIAKGTKTAAPVDLNKVVHDVIESYPAFQSNSAVIELKGPFPMVLGAEAVLSQCVSNILSNAVKFVSPGVTPRVQVWTETSGGKVRLFFKDNGLGIPARAHQKIFAIFERVSNNYEGTGIGLSIVKKGIEQMGGAVGLESEPGKGTTFWLELKLAETAKS